MKVSKYHFIYFSELHKYYSISILYKTSQILLHFNSFWKFTNTISSHFQNFKITNFRSLRKPFHFENFTNTNIPFEFFSENKKYYLISIRFGSYHLIKVPWIRHNWYFNSFWKLPSNQSTMNQAQLVFQFVSEITI